MEVRELVTKLGFDVDETTLNRFERGIEATKTSLEALIGIEAGALAAVYEFTKKTSEYGEEIKRSALITGLSVENYQKYRFAANMAGAENEEFTVGIRYLNRATGEAIRGMGEFTEAFKLVGISVQDLKTKSMDQLIPMIAEGLAKIPNVAVRASIGMQLFGRGGALMTSFLARGREELQKYGDEVEAFGLMTKDQADEAEHFEQSQKQLMMVIVGLRNYIGLQLFPVVKGIMDKFREWVIANRELVKTQVDKFMKSVAEFARTLWGVFISLVAAAKDISVVFGGMANMLKLVLLGLVAITGSQILVGFGALLTILKAINVQQLRLWITNPYFLIAAGVVFLVLALQDLYVWFKGGDAAMGAFWQNFFGPLAQAKTAMKSFKDFFEYFLKGLESLGGLIATVLESPFKAIWKILVDDYQKYVPAWMRALIEKGAGAIGGGIADIGRDIAQGAGNVNRGVNNFVLAADNRFPGLRNMDSGGAYVRVQHDVALTVNAGPGTTKEHMDMAADSFRPVIREEISKAAGNVVANNPRREVK